jgi:hypothetical protein
MQYFHCVCVCDELTLFLQPMTACLSPVNQDIAKNKLWNYTGVIKNLGPWGIWSKSSELIHQIYSTKLLPLPFTPLFFTHIKASNYVLSKAIQAVRQNQKAALQVGKSFVFTKKGMFFTQFQCVCVCDENSDLYLNVVNVF